MAKGSVSLAANQGLLYVLSMVVIGGLVGGGALGYDSVLGFSQSDSFGKGLCAALAIVLLGIMLDRVFRWTAERSTARQEFRQKREKSLRQSINSEVLPA
jgi:glycine betaine/proline transport system permease protein